MLTEAVREHLYDEPLAAADALARCVAGQLRTALSAHGVAVLAVSGGKSPVPFFHALRREDLDWSRVRITLVDERCVPESHPDSNARLVREHLLAERAQAACLVSWLPGIDNPADQSPDALVAHARQQCQGLPPVWDVAVLGMGEDAHTASWFPDSEGLETALSSPLTVTWVRPRHAPHLRLTLTLAALQRCRHVHLAIAGPTKTQVYRQARQTVGPAMPVSIALARAAEADVWIAR